MQYVADATCDYEISDSLSAATRRGTAVFVFQKTTMWRKRIHEGRRSVPDRQNKARATSNRRAMLLVVVGLGQTDAPGIYPRSGRRYQKIFAVCLSCNKLLSRIKVGKCLEQKISLDIFRNNFQRRVNLWTSAGFQIQR